jgi:hypothetical protein
VTSLQNPDKNNFQAPSGAASFVSDTFSKRAESFSDSIAPPGLEILLILVSAWARQRFY